MGRPAGIRPSSLRCPSDRSQSRDSPPKASSLPPAWLQGKLAPLGKVLRIGEVMDGDETSWQGGQGLSLTRTFLLSAVQGGWPARRRCGGKERSSGFEQRTPGGSRAGARCPLESPAVRPSHTQRCSRRRGGSSPTWPGEFVEPGERAGCGGKEGSGGVSWGRTDGTTGDPGTQSTAPCRACSPVSGGRGTGRMGEAGGRRRGPCSGWERRTTECDFASSSSHSPTGCWWATRWN